ncbi:MAG: cupin domain-containing protein [Pseudomonadota bacterium]
MFDDASRPTCSTLVELGSPYSDARGAIQPLVEGGFASAQAISSTAGSVRANHFHKEDWHYCYMVTGGMNYWFRPVGSSEQPHCIRVEAGQMIFTPAMEEHAMEFTEDSVFINFANRQRDQASYEQDLVRIDLIPVAT